MTDKTKADWQAAAQALKIDGRAFINGRSVNALSGETRPTFSPADGREIAQVA